MNCQRCNHEFNAETSKFCPECGAPANVFCSKCGKQHGQKFCPECGTQAQDYVPPRPTNTQVPPVYAAPAAAPIIINNSNQNVNTNTNINSGLGVLPPPKSKTTALLLCIFLGFFGGHCFYTGKTGLGILYIFTYGLFGIGWIIDIIRILTGSYRDKWGQPLV